MAATEANPLTPNTWNTTERQQSVNKRRDRTAQLVMASRRRVLAEQIQNTLEQRRFDRLVQDGVIVKAVEALDREKHRVFDEAVIKSMLNTEGVGSGEGGGRLACKYLSIREILNSKDSLDMLDIYYIDYYDMNDGWLGWEYIEEFRKDRIFTDYDSAYRVKDALNAKMDFNNVQCGEYYDVKQVPKECLTV